MSSFRAVQQTRNADVFPSRQCHCSVKLSCYSGYEMGNDRQALMTEDDQKVLSPDQQVSSSREAQTHTKLIFKLQRGPRHHALCKPVLMQEERY